MEALGQGTRDGQAGTATTRPFSSLYIHVPFCSAKCDYCAFYSEAGLGPEDHRRYLERLKEEMCEHAAQCAPLSSIFIGGGTPSVLSLDEWAALDAAIKANFTIDKGCEWTIEANPESLTAEMIQTWASFGVTRISLGVQAFQKELRDAIGRRSSIEKLPMLAKTARACNISDLNFDLIFNIPGQSLKQWRESLMQAMELAPDHISAYALTIEEGTRLAARTPRCTDDRFVEFWDMTDSILGEHGLHRYEISNFAAPGHECRHNFSTWHGGTYLGCGPAAASFDGRDRFCNAASLERWLKRQPSEVDRLRPDERAAEILATGMRCIEGWDCREFHAITGFDCLGLRGASIGRLMDNGLLERQRSRLRPTRQGLLFNDDVAMALLWQDE